MYAHILVQKLSSKPPPAAMSFSAMKQYIIKAFKEVPQQLDLKSIDSLPVSIFWQKNCGQEKDLLL